MELTPTVNHPDAAVLPLCLKSGIFLEIRVVSDFPSTEESDLAFRDNQGDPSAHDGNC
jgi:hypothetical protein